MGPRPHLWFFVFKAATLAPELQVSKGPSLPSVVFACKTRLLDLHYKSLWVPDLTYGFLHTKQRD